MYEQKGEGEYWIYDGKSGECNMYALETGVFFTWILNSLKELANMRTKPPERTKKAYDEALEVEYITI